MHCSAVVVHSLSRKSNVSAAAVAADELLLLQLLLLDAGGDTNGWKHDNLECRPLNSPIACSPVACSPVACSPVACLPVVCSPLRGVLPLSSRTLRVPSPNSRKSAQIFPIPIRYSQLLIPGNGECPITCLGQPPACVIKKVIYVNFAQVHNFPPQVSGCNHA